MGKIFEFDGRFLISIQELVDKNHWLNQVWIFLAQYLIYGLPILLLVLWFWSAPTKKAVFKSVVAAVFGWLVFGKALALLVNRPRPEAFAGTQELLFHRPDTSFPSDHAALLFALALSMRLHGYKRLGNIMFIIAGIISITRVFVGVHYPLDVIVGAIVGCIAAVLFWLIDEYLDRYLAVPVLGFLKRFRL
ncbi:MAG: phosphatase PAP2 family protein [bacterium]|nr:phosphatase PAP2 family protein [bacterium]